MHRALWALGLVLSLLVAWPAAADEPVALRLQISDPRAFGHQVGDVVTRRIVIEVPRRLRLVEESLPTTGRVRQALELGRVRHDTRPTLQGTRHTLQLEYQIFHAPREPRVLDLPSFTLRFEGEPRAEEQRIDFAPIMVAPLTPQQPVLRAGLGTLRPDQPPLRIDARPERLRLAAYAVLALLPLSHLACVYLGAPWWHRRQRPFARVQRQVRALSLSAPAEEWQAAWRALHAALDTTAGEVLHAGALERFVDKHPRFILMRAELSEFFERSQALFFRSQPALEADRLWLRAFCARCFNIERGAA